MGGMTASFNQISKEQGALLYSAIDHMYVLLERVVDVIDKDDAVGKRAKLDVTGDFVDVARESTEFIAVDYAEWFEKGQQYDPKAVEKRESASMKIYEALIGFIERCNGLPSTHPKKIPLEESHASDHFFDSSMLARVGTGKGDLQQGGLWERLHEQMERLPELRELIQAVRNCGIHMWRIVHAFISRGLSFVRNIHKMIPMRRAAEMRMEVANQAHLQTQKDQPSSEVREAQASRMGQHYFLSR